MLLVRFCNDAAYEGGSGSLLPVKLAAKLDDIDGVRPVNMLLAAAKLSRLGPPRDKGIFVVPKPKAILVNISNPVGYPVGKEGARDFDDFVEDGNTGIFNCGVSNL